MPLAICGTGCYEDSCCRNTTCYCCQIIYLFCCAYPVYVGTLPRDSGVCCAGRCCGSFTTRLLGFPCVWYVLYLKS
eukprot:9499070-Pyramimonas_sp.AAC.3